MANSIACLLYGVFLTIITFSVGAVPFRGLQSVDPGVGLQVPIPLPIEGSCTAGTEYTVNSITDLYEHGQDLECIFAAGKTPSDVPLGLGYGYLLSAMNTGFWNSIAEIFYQGDAVVKTQCKGEFHNIGWLSIAGLDVGVSKWSLDDIDWTLAPGEYPLGDESYVLMDFTVNFNDLCPAEGNESPFGLQGFSPFVNSIFPLNQFKDVMRHVGFDESDGGAIFLNKAYIYSATQGAYTVLIYAIKSFDPKASQALSPGESVSVPLGPNGESTIMFSRPGMDSVITRVFQALSNPAQLAAGVANREAERRSKAAANVQNVDNVNSVLPQSLLSVLTSLSTGGNPENTV